MGALLADSQFAGTHLSDHLPPLAEHSIQLLSALSLGELQKDDVRLVATNDLRAFERQMLSAGARENHPMMSPRHNDFGSADSLGLLLLNGGEEVLGGIAARVVDLGADSLATHMEENYRRLYGGGEVDVITSRCSAANQINGRVVYQGQWYFRESSRGSLHTPAMFHYFHSLCFAKWRPDWVYGFFPVRLAERAFVHGYPHTYLQAHRWHIEADRRGPKECLVCSSFEEFVERAESLIEHPEFFPEKPHPQKQ